MGDKVLICSGMGVRHCVGGGFRMFKNYFKTAWRGLLNNRVFSLLNILGLGTGMAVALLIGLWVNYHYSFDRWLPNYQRVYQAGYRSVSNGIIETQTSVSYPLAEVIRKDVPGVEYVIPTDWDNYHGLVHGSEKVYLPGLMAGADFLKAFEYPLVQGNAGQVLKDRYSIVLTESTAKALFGREDAVGKTVRIDNYHDLTVTGILRDIPANTSIGFQYIVPFEFFRESVGNGEHWGNNNIQTFVRLKPGVSYAQVEPLLRPLIKRYDPLDYQTNKYEVFLHPLKDWHLYSGFVNGVASGGFIDTVRLFAIIGLLVLVIAGINFVNLSTARSEKRSREVGIRKVVGSLRRDLVMQFLVESVVLTMLAFGLALVMVQAVLPAFNSLTGDVIRVPYTSGVFWMVMAGYVLLTGVLAGSRPAFYLSAFNPIRVLKGSLKVGKASALPRRVMVTLQFAASVGLIITTVIVYQQIQYAKDRPLGYDQQRLIMSDVSPDVQKNYVALKGELLRSGVVSSVTKSSSRVTTDGVYDDIDAWPGKMPGETLGMLTVALSDADYFQTMGMRFSSGANFTSDLGADTLNVILNEAAVKRMRLKEPLGQTITWAETKRVRIIGVVKNALMGSPFSPAIPTMFIYDPSWAYVMTYRIADGVPTAKAIATLTGIFNKYNPSFPYQYGFVDKSYEAKFGLETLIGKLAGLFAGLAIFISCLGLFGLAAYVAEQRTKEIGVRKVLGASVGQVWMLLSRDFVALVLVGVVVATPVSLYFMRQWLQQFDYRISISPWVFVGAGLAALAITVVTVSFQAVKAAVMNPVKALRSE
jgi:putative ABC transport system permease protein